MRKVTQVLLAFFVAICPSFCMAQVATGAYAFGSYDNKGFDTINLGNLNVMFSVPILSKAGRAGTSFSYQLGYNSSIFTPATVNGVKTWTPAQNWGWQGQTQVLTGYISEIQRSLVCTGSRAPYDWISDVVYHDAFGVAHRFAGSAKIPTSACTGNTDTLTNSYSQDGEFQYTANGIVTRKGVLLNAPVNLTSAAATYQDSNGNEITADGNGNFKDTTGNTVLSITGTGTPQSPMTFTYKDTSGTGRFITVAYTSYSIKTNFSCSGVSEYQNSSIPLITSITYPDGSSYQFSYEANPNVPNTYTGRILTVTLPTGGQISYSYSTTNDGVVCSDGSGAALTRTMGSSQWSYSRTPGSSKSSTSVTDGLGNKTDYTFVVGANDTENGIFYYETNRNAYQGTDSGTPLLSRQTCYNGATPPNCSSQGFTYPITSISTYETLNGIQEHGSDLTYNSYGLLTDEKDYDFGGSSQRGPLLRHEVWTYPSSGLVGLLQSDIVYDGSNNTESQTAYRYDETTPASSSGVPQHISVSGQRGNLTSVTQYAFSNTSYTTKYTYEDTGSMLTTLSPVTTSGATTSYSYDPSFVYSTGTQLPTPSNGVSLSASQSYDQSYTGLPQTFNDVNGQPTNVYSYDSMLRPTQINDPDGGKIIYVYDSPTQNDVETYQNSSTYEDTRTTLDAYGRLSVVAVQSTPSNWYDTTYCYDANGRLQFKSYPALNQTGCTLSGDTYSYDALGRAIKILHADGTYKTLAYSGHTEQWIDENGVQRLSTIDGLDRTTGVCEITGTQLTGSPAPSACTNVDISGKGYTTTYAYVAGKTTITQGTQTRVFTTDWLGRTTGIQQPEVAGGLSTYFSYSVNSTGPVVTRTAPKANQGSASVTTNTTTQYDNLGRSISISYTDGTPTKSFVYDTSVGWSIIPQPYIKGRLSYAFVNGPGNGATSAWSYDQMGRVTESAACSPAVCGSGAGSMSYTYDWAGNLTSETDGASGDISYGRSLAGETTSITNETYQGTGNPASLVSSVVNGPDGPTSYQLGNGLSVAISYDSLGRFFGRWVCQNSLQPYCTGGTQTYGLDVMWRGSQAASSCDTVIGKCYQYGYDAFNRLTSITATSGSAYNFTYSYDRWGNRWAQNALDGGPAPSVSFNTTTNQISSSGYSYDAAGNLTNDGAHTYTYDAEGNVTAVDGGNTAKHIYDALSRRVESQTVSAKNDYNYDYTGHRISTYLEPSGWGDEGRIYWGNQVIAFRAAIGYTYFEHQDWLGTTRMRTDYQGGIAATFTSLPFGDGSSDTVKEAYADQDNTHFAMLDLDNESNTDHATFRQYGNMQSRWMSPDPYTGSYDLSNPQSMNRYTYAMNNPVAFIDPSGLDEHINLVYGGDGCWDASYYTDEGDADEVQAEAGAMAFCEPTGSSWVFPDAGGDSGGGGGGGQQIADVITPNNMVQPPTACQIAVLNAVNHQFGTNLTAQNILPTSDPNPTLGGGQVNVNFGTGYGLAPAQFNAIQPGRYAPPGFLGVITGYGPSLHVVASPTGLDPTAGAFASSNFGGIYSVGFTAHIDSAWADNPIGALLHWIIDVLGHNTRNPCP